MFSLVTAGWVYLCLFISTTLGVIINVSHKTDNPLCTLNCSAQLMEIKLPGRKLLREKRKRVCPWAVLIKSFFCIRFLTLTLPTLTFLFWMFPEMSAASSKKGVSLTGTEDQDKCVLSPLSIDKEITTDGYFQHGKSCFHLVSNTEWKH